MPGAGRFSAGGQPPEQIVQDGLRQPYRLVHCRRSKRLGYTGAPNGCSTGIDLLAQALQFLVFVMHCSAGGAMPSPTPGATEHSVFFSSSSTIALGFVPAYPGHQIIAVTQRFDCYLMS